MVIDSGLFCCASSWYSDQMISIKASFRYGNDSNVLSLAYLWSKLVYQHFQHHVIVTIIDSCLPNTPWVAYWRVVWAMLSLKNGEDWQPIITAGQLRDHKKNVRHGHTAERGSFLSSTPQIKTDKHQSTRNPIDAWCCRHRGIWSVPVAHVCVRGGVRSLRKTHWRLCTRK